MISRRQFLRSLAALGAAGAASLGYALFEPVMRPRITRYALQPARWTSGLDLTIAVLADIHACRPWMDIERIRSIVDMTNELSADLIVLLGDYLVSDNFYRRFATGEVAPQEWAAEL